MKKHHQENSQCNVFALKLLPQYKLIEVLEKLNSVTNFSYVYGTN